MSGHRVGHDLYQFTTVGAGAIADPGDGGTINLEPGVSHGAVRLATAGAETRTLADPTGPGLRLSLYFTVDGDDCVITSSSAVNQAGNTSLTFADIGDHLALESIEDAPDSYEWHVLANDGVALA